MAERWQEVGEQLGLKLPDYVGRLVVPLFDQETGGHTVMQTATGRVIGRLIDNGGKNAAGMPDLTLVTANTNTNGWVTVEQHRPRELPESPWGPVRCDMTDFREDYIFLGLAPRTGAGVGVTPLPAQSHLEIALQTDAITRLDTLQSPPEGSIDIFNPDAAEQAAELLRQFDGHRLGPTVRHAMVGHFGVMGAAAPAA